MRRLALAGVIANTVIMSTGAAVRLSASGLGCPDWPQCSTADIVASKNAGQTLLNTWIEFGNRLLNFPLVIIAALIFIAAWRFRPDGRRRRDLVWLGAAQPLGVVAQAVIGGIVVLTKLNPATVSVHFLVSAAVVAAAVALHMRCAALARSPQELGGRGGLGGTVSPQEQGGSGGDRSPREDTVTDEMIAELLANPFPGSRRPQLKLAGLIPVAHGFAALTTFMLAVLAAIGAR